MKSNKKTKTEFCNLLNKDISEKGFCLVYAFLESRANNPGFRFYLCNGELKSEKWIFSDFVRKKADTKKTNNTWKVYASALFSLFPKKDREKYCVEKIKVSNESEWRVINSRLRFVFFLTKKEMCDFVSVDSIDTFLKQIISDNIDLKEKGINTYYRGQLAHWDINPSLYREKMWVKKETELNASILCDRPNDFQNCKSSFDKLVKLKHYNQPSRLMDLTTNPLVALFFACDSMINHPSFGLGLVIPAYSKEGSEKISVVSDTVIMLTALTNSKRSSGINSVKCVCSQDKIIPARLFNDSSCKKCLDEYEKDNAKKPDCFSGKDGSKKSVSDYLREISHQAKKESGSELYWDDLTYGELNQCVLIKPPLNTDRIVQQQGCFIMCGLNPIVFDSVPESYYEFFKPITGKRKIYYVIPDNLEIILKELKVLGIDKYYIFPDLEKDIDVRKNLIKIVSEKN